MARADRSPSSSAARDFSGSVPRSREIVVVDARRARRLLLVRTARGSLHVEEVEQLEESWDEKQHHRPSMLAAHGRSFAGTSHEREERRSRFARDVARWLASGATGAGARTVLCSAPMLGALRKEAPATLLPRLDLREIDLCWLNLDELARHPAVLELAPPA